MKEVAKSRRLPFLTAVLMAIVLASAGALTAGAVVAAAEDSGQPEILSLYDETPANALDASAGAVFQSIFSNYFNKDAQLTFGDPAKTYGKVLLTAVKNKDGIGPVMEIRYDISAYRYNYFTVGVGSTNRAADFTNVIEYSVKIDGVEAAKSSPLEAYQVEFLQCAVPEGARELTLYARSTVYRVEFGDAGFIAPTLSSLTKDATKNITLEQPVDVSLTDEGYCTGTFNAATGTGADDHEDWADSVRMAIHGDYGTDTPIYKTSLTYDIAGLNYNTVSARVAFQFNTDTQDNNAFRYAIKADDVPIASSGDVPVSYGTVYTFTDVVIPRGTQRLTFWTDSVLNTKAYGEHIWNSIVLSNSVYTPALSGAVTAHEADLRFGRTLPEISGDFFYQDEPVAGDLYLDKDQSLVLGTHSYRWTFVPELAIYETVTGTVELTVTQDESLRLASLSFDDLFSWIPPGTSSPWYSTASLTVGGVTYRNSFSVCVTPDAEGYTSGRIDYDISAFRYDRFTAVVGSNNQNDGFTNEIVYQVLCDGKVVYTTSKALKADETEAIGCPIPEGTRKLSLYAYSAIGSNRNGDAGWNNATLHNANAADTLSLAGERPVDASLADEGYSTGTFNAATGAGADDHEDWANSVMMAIHGDYGTPGSPLYKSSLTYDIGGMGFNCLSVKAAHQYNPTSDAVFVFTIFADGVELASSGPVGYGEVYRFTDIVIPRGTQQLQFYTVAPKNTKAYGEHIWNAPTLSYRVDTPESEAVTAAGSSHRYGDPLPDLTGNFTGADGKPVPGLLQLDAGQTLTVGTHSYRWTFTPSDTFLFRKVAGNIELTVGKATIDLSSIRFEDRTVAYDGSEQSLTITGTLPEGVTVRYTGNKGTLPGVYQAIASFLVSDEQKGNYEDIPSLAATLTITPLGYLEEDASYSYVKGTEGGVTIALQEAPGAVTLSGDGQEVAGDCYTLDGKTLTLTREYLDTLEPGTHAFTASCDGGGFAFTVTVNKAQKKGCGSKSSASALGLGLLLAAGTVLVLKRRKLL